VICPTVCIVLTVLHVISISNHLMIPHAILTSNSLRHQHHLLVLPVCLLLYHFFKTNTELYSLLLFDNSDLSNFIEPFPCDLSAHNFQTKYSMLNETGKMNHASKPKNLSYFHFNVRSLGKNKHKLDDFFPGAQPGFLLGGG